MATGSLYGSSSESTGLYGIGAASGGTYFEWFVFQDSLTAPATPTGGSWSFSNNTGTAPTGWVISPPPAPVNQIWVSIAVVDSRDATTFTWSVPGLMAASGLPILSASGVPSSGTGANGQLYINTATTPQGLYFKQSGAWTQLTGSNFVDLVNNQTIGGVKTFSQTIQGNISGNAGNVTGTVAVANGGTGATTAADARINLGLGNIATQNASAVAITGGSISGITDLAVADGGTGASSASVARSNLGAVGLSDTQTLTNKTISGASNTLTNIPNASLVNDSVNVNGVDLTLGAVQLLGADWILPDYAGNAGKVLAVNTSASDVQWISAGGVGSVTSVDVSGGTTGLTTTGGPITAAGVITLGGTLAIANGGTGATTAATARTNLGLGSAAVLTAGAANGVATLDAGGTVPLSQIPASIQGGVSYQGTWNATTNTPTLTSSVGSKGYYYVISVAGSTNLNGITNWNIGDWAIFNGTAWEKIDNTDAVTSVNGYTGTVVLTNTDISGFGTMSTQNANAVAITGGTATLTSLTVNDNTTLGSSNTDTTTFNGRIASEFTPATNNAYDLGRNSHEWRNLFLIGTANIAALTTSGTVTHNGGTANGVAFLNGSKVLTTGSALTFDGTNFQVNGSVTATAGNMVVSAGKGVAFSGDQTRIFTPEDNVSGGLLQWGAGGVLRFNAGSSSELMRLTSTGLGIGTSSPAAPLQIGDGTQTAREVRTSTLAGAGQGGFLRGFRGGNASFYVGDSAPISGSSAGGMTLFTYGATSVDTYTNGILRSTLDSSGNLGLGVTPSAWVTTTTSRAIQFGRSGSLFYSTDNAQAVFGTNYCQTGANSFIYLSNGFAQRYAQNDFDGAHKWFTAPSGTAGNAISFNQAMTLGSDANLAVGTTTTTAARLTSVGTPALSAFSASISNDLNSSSVAVITAGANTNGGIWGGGGTGLRIIDRSSNSGSGQTGTGLYIAAPYDGANASGSTYALTKYGIYVDDIYSFYGVNSPTGNVNWGLYVKGGASNYIAGNLLVGTTSTINAAKAVVSFSSANNGLYINDSTGVSGAQFMRFDSTSGVCGSIVRVTTTSAVTYNTTSDHRLKTVIGPVADAGQRIDALQPVEYTWNASGERTRGFLAHQFQEVYAGSVSGTKDAVDAEGKPVYQAMQASSSEVIADLVAELQSLRARVAQLESN